MYVLGISDGRLNSGVALMKDDEVLFCVNEERLQRKKNKGGFPVLSVEQAIQESKIRHKDINAIAVGGIYTPNVFIRLFRSMNDRMTCNYAHRGLKSEILDILEHKSGFTYSTIPKRYEKEFLSLVHQLIRKDLPRGLKKKPIRFFDHHLCHAASAYYTSGKRKALCITCDGGGDGIFYSANIIRGGAIKRFHSISCRHSLGEFYTLITSYLGFTPHRHECKVTGLAAHGKPSNVKVDFPFEIQGTTVVYKSRFGRAGIRQMKQLLSSYSRKDIAAWLQFHTEDVLTGMIRFAIKKTGLSDIVLAGGVFANVKMNQRIHEMDGVTSIYVFPQMDDAGLALGAALAYSKPSPRILKHVFFGKSFTDEEIEKSLTASGLQFERYKKIEKKIAHLLSEAKVVARFNGRMEYGPRALGNRSILYQTTDKTVNDWLNKNLRRTEFMPFAPAVQYEYADSCFHNIKGAEHTAEFMTITLNCTGWTKKHCPGIVHLDGTARPQFVVKQNNPGFHAIINEYRKLTGIPMVINTSFNMHEEPIVQSPDDAIRSFKESGIDALAIGNCLVEGKQVHP